MQWGSNEEPYWRSPQRSQSITLIKARLNKVRDRATLLQIGTFLSNSGPRNEEPNVSSQSPSSVKSGSRSQPQLKFSPGQISQACPQWHLDIKSMLKHEYLRMEELTYMWWKTTLKDIHEAAFARSSLPHLSFRGRPTNFNFRSSRFSEKCPRTIRTTSRLSRWFIHWNSTTSWCHLQDITV